VFRTYVETEQKTPARKFGDVEKASLKWSKLERIFLISNFGKEGGVFLEEHLSNCDNIESEA
jgi:hypothetical protein